MGLLINRRCVWERERERRERQTGETARQTGKRSEFCLFAFRVTGSDLVPDRPFTGGSRPVETSQISSVRGLGLLLQFTGSTVQSQQHGDGFLQELAELRQPLGADRPVHHPVVAAQCHRHHAGYVKSAKPRNTHAASDLTCLECSCPACCSVVTHWPFLIISRHQPFLWAADGENTGLRRVDYRREVLDTKHPQIRDRERTSLVEKKQNKNTHTFLFAGSLDKTKNYPTCTCRIRLCVVPGTHAAAACRLSPWQRERTRRSWWSPVLWCAH